MVSNFAAPYKIDTKVTKMFVVMLSGKFSLDMKPQLGHRYIIKMNYNTVDVAINTYV